MAPDAIMAAQPSQSESVLTTTTKTTDNRRTKRVANDSSASDTTNQFTSSQSSQSTGSSTTGTSTSSPTEISSSEQKPVISDLQKVDKKIRTTKQTVLYESEFLTSHVEVASDQVYQAKGQRQINGQTYYYVESAKQKGYLLASDVADFKKIKSEGTLTGLNDQSYYRDFDFTVAGHLAAGRQYYTNGYYSLKGMKYYSIYSQDKNGKRSWLGYVSEKNVRLLKLEKFSKQVTVKKAGKRYQNFFWQSKGDLKVGDVYRVNGQYRLGDGRTYYTLYRTGKDGKEKWYGYANATMFSDLKMVKKELNVTVIHNYKRYKDFYFNKKGDTEKGEAYRTRGYYQLGNGEKYYSLYKLDKKGNQVWQGYTNVKNFRQLTLKKQTKKVTITKDSNRYQNFFWNVRGKAEKGQVYESHGYYELGNGRKYYSLYKTDKNGKSNWYGYTNVNFCKDLKPVEMKARAKVVKNYKRYKDFFWNSKGDLKSYQNKKVVVKRRYMLGDGRTYYSIYTTGDRWLGYVNSKALKVYRYKKLNVPNYNQYAYHVPTGCEGTALLQALQYKGYVKKETPTTFLKKIPRTNSPYTGFGGNPFLPDAQYGFPAIFSKPLAKWGKKYGNVIDYSGKSFSTAIDEVMKGNPSVIYVTVGLKPVQWQSYWFGPAVINNHAVTLAGYDEENGKVYLSDSISGKYWVSYAKVKKIYDARKWTVTVRSK